MAEVVAMDAARRAMRTFFNAQLPINKLPSEILTRIFYYCTFPDSFASSGDAVYAESRRNPDTWTFRPPWVGLTYVCHLWRNTALNCPTLWASQITDDFGLQTMETMLERSKHAPVSLRIHWYLSCLGRCEDLVVQHLSHMRAIHFAGIYPHIPVSKLVPDSLRAPAPILEELSAKLSYSTLPLGPFFLCDDIFSSQAPLLRRLILADHFPPLATPVSPILLNIEYLDISMYLGRQWDHPKFTRDFLNGPDVLPYLKLFSILPHLKSLKTLALKYCLLPRIAFDSANQQTVEFPHLQSLEIDDGANECVDFLRCMRIPATAQLSIKCILAQATLKQTCSTLAPLLRARLDAAPAPIQALAVMTPDLHRQTTFSLTAWRAPVSFPLPSAQPAPALALQIDARQRTRDDLADVTRFLHDLPLASARTAHFMLRGELVWNAVGAAAVLDCAPAVESLWATGPGCTAVIQALCPHAAAVGAPPAMGLPALRVLGLTGLDLWAVTLASTNAQTKELRSEQNCSRLEAFLKVRKDAQGRALKLLMPTCVLKDRWMDVLRGQAEVEWFEGGVRGSVPLDRQERNFGPGRIVAARIWIRMRPQKLPSQS